MCIIIYIYIYNNMYIYIIMMYQYHNISISIHIYIYILIINPTSYLFAKHFPPLPQFHSSEVLPASFARPSRNSMKETVPLPSWNRPLVTREATDVAGMDGEGSWGWGNPGSKCQFIHLWCPVLGVTVCKGYEIWL